MAEINKLNVQKIRSLSNTGRYLDGLGLYLAITKTGTKNWVFRYSWDGKRRDMGLGRIEDVSLAEARERRDAARRLLDMGKDPLGAKKEAQRLIKAEEQAEPEKKIPTFRECAKAVITLRQPEWKNVKHAAQWASTLERYVYPKIGNLSVDEVTEDHILKILQPIWLSKNETAGRVRGRIETVLGWAKAKKYRSGPNPATWKDNLEFLLQKPSIVKKVSRQPSLHYKHVPFFMARLLNLKTSTAYALATVILTGLRSSEVRLAQHSELDDEAGVWTIPIDRVKAPQKDGDQIIPHCVPLGPVECALMQKLPGAPDDFVFPGASSDKAISETSVRKLISTHGKEWGHFSMHGFRSSFKDWVMEQSELLDKDMLSEAQLGHKLGSGVKVAYLRTNLLERRRALMQGWCSHCLSETTRETLCALGLMEEQIEALGLGTA